MNEKPLGYCEFHEANVFEEEFAWKGCWNCYHFAYSADFPYFDVYEAANTLKKSPSTIRRWLNEGHLHGGSFLSVEGVNFNWGVHGSGSSVKLRQGWSSRGDRFPVVLNTILIFHSI